MNSEMSKTISDKYAGYSETVRERMLRFREYIFSVAKQLEIYQIEESLKWGELTFTVKGGSPFRVNWKATSPDKLFLYFHCQTKLVATFKEVYPQAFIYHGNRALEVAFEDLDSSPALTHCLTLALTYKKVKHLPLLGA